jgi:hypothetical protein
VFNKGCHWYEIFMGCGTGRSTKQRLSCLTIHLLVVLLLLLLSQSFMLRATTHAATTQSCP